MKFIFAGIGALLVGIVTAVVVAVSYAEDPATLICEEALKDSLKAPKSYERVQTFIQGLTGPSVMVWNGPSRMATELPKVAVCSGR